MSRPTPIGTSYEILALAREGMRQGVTAATVGVARINILLRQATTAKQEPGKSTRASRKTTDRQ